jgi:hypothetical protein
VSAATGVATPVTVGQATGVDGALAPMPYFVFRYSSTPARDAGSRAAS